ncbi:MAG: caspase family protein [Putridiphycobacter sp.]
MIRISFVLLGVLFVGQLLSQVNTVFPLSAKLGMKTGGFSMNGEYAFITTANFPSYNVDVSIFNIDTRKPIKNFSIISEDDMEPWSISNDGKNLLMYYQNSKNLVYDLILDSLKESSGSGNSDQLALSLQEQYDLFFPSSADWLDFGDYWFTQHYALRSNKGNLEVYDSLTKKTELFPLSSFPNLKNNDKNALGISPNSNYLAYINKSILYLYNFNTKEQIGQYEVDIARVQELSVRDDGVVCILGFLEDDKDIGLHWFDTKQQKFIENSTRDGLLNLTYVSQFYKFLSIGFGTKDKKRVQKSQFIDLSSGEFSAIVNGNGWVTFNGVQKFVKDTLSRDLLTSEEFNVINSSPVYFNYFQMRADYFNSDDEYDPQTDNPQVSETFFQLIDELNWSIEVLTAHENKVTFQNTTGDLPFFGLTLKKKMVFFWNGEKKNPKERVVKLFITNELKPVFYCDDNYYYCPAGMSNLIGFEKDYKYYAFEQFDLKYNRPDIILDRLGYADSALVEAYHQAYLKRLKKMGFTEEMLEDDFHLPEIKIENFEEMPAIYDQGSINLKLKLQDSKYKLDRINVWVNDVAIYGINGISLRDKNLQDYQTDLEVYLAKGNNKIQVSVLNQAGAESYKETFEIECTVGKKQPDLYLITIGESQFQQSNYNLTYAAKDAQDMVALFEKSKVYKNVYSKTLVNEQVTKENILALKSFIENADINDEVMIFIAGHGVLDANLDYYFATYDMDFMNPAERGLAYEDLESLLDGIKPLKKTLLIDACHSGEIDKEEVELAQANITEESDIQFRVVGNTATPKLGAQNTSELTKSLFTDLRKGTGATVISSAGGMEFAMEGDDWKNGLFTYCFIKGIKTKAADLNKDGEIWLSEIQQYVAEQVYELSGGRQQPTSRIENQTIDFRVW